MAEWDVLQYFYQEADENLSGLEQAILSMEKGHLDAKTEILRLAHSTKGAANSMGMFRIAKLMHALEDLFERVAIEVLEQKRLPKGWKGLNKLYPIHENLTFQSKILEDFNNSAAPQRLSQDVPNAKQNFTIDLQIIAVTQN